MSPYLSSDPHVVFEHIKNGPPPEVPNMYKEVLSLPAISDSDWRKFGQGVVRELHNPKTQALFDDAFRQMLKNEKDIPETFRDLATRFASIDANVAEKLTGIAEVRLHSSSPLVLLHDSSE